MDKEINRSINREMDTQTDKYIHTKIDGQRDSRVSWQTALIEITWRYGLGMPLSAKVMSSPSSPLIVIPNTWSTHDTMPGPSKSYEKEEKGEKWRMKRRNKRKELRGVRRGEEGNRNRKKQRGKWQYQKSRRNQQIDRNMNKKINGDG